VVGNPPFGVSIDDRHPLQPAQFGQSRRAIRVGRVVAAARATDTPIPARLAEAASQDLRGHGPSGRACLPIVSNLGSLERHHGGAQLPF